MKLSVLVLSCERVRAMQLITKRLYELAPFEVIIMDNSIREVAKESVRVLANKYGFKVIQEEHTPFNLSGMRNLGIEAATGDVLVFLDSDIVPINDDFLEKIEEFHKHNKKLLIHARYKGGKDTARLTYVAEKPTIFDKHRIYSIEKGRPWRASSGGNCSIRKDILGDVRFDTRYTGGWGWEDADFTRQLWDKNIDIVFDPTICAKHIEHPIVKTNAASNYEKFWEKWNPETFTRFQELIVRKNLPSPRPELGRYFKHFEQDFHSEKRVLDIGCGKGLFSHYISSKYGCEVTALDTYAANGNRPEDLDVNEEFKSFTKDGVNIVTGDIREYKNDYPFDVIFARISMHHIIHTTQRLGPEAKCWEDLVAVFTKIYKLLKDKGTFYIIDVLPVPEKNVHYARNMANGVKPGSKHTPQEWMRGLLAAGFENFETRHIWPSKSRYPEQSKAMSIKNRMDKFGYKYIMQVRKGIHV
jgi:SAM-dependent methyltransferase